MGGSAVSIITTLGQMLTQKDESGKYIASGIVDSLSELITQALQDVVALIPSLSGAITGIIGEIGKVLTAKDENDQYVASSISQSLVALVTNAVDTAISAIPSLSDAIGGIINAIGNVLTSQDSEGNYIITSIADSMFTLVKSAVESVSAAIPQLSGLIAGIIGKIGEILAQKDETTGKYKATGIIDSLSEMVANAIETVVNLIPSLSESINGIIGAIGDVLLSKDDEGNYLITSLSESLISLVTSAVTAAVAAIPSIADTITGIIGAIAGVLSEKDDAGNYKLTGIADSLTQMVRDAIDTVISVIPTLGSSAAQILTAIGTALFGTGDNEGAVSQGVEALTGIVQTIFTELNTKVIPSMGTEVGKILTTIAGFFTPEKMKELGSGLGDLAGSLLTGIVDTLVATVDAILAIGDETDTEGMFEGITTGISSFAEKVIDALAGAIPKVIGAGGKILSRIAEIFTPENISSAITEAQNVARGLMDTILEAFTGEQDAANKVDLFGTFAKIVGNIIDGLKDVFTPENIEKNAINVEGFVTGLIDSISTSLSDGIDTVSEEGIFGKFIGLLKNLVSGIVKAIPHAFKVGEKAVTAGFQIATELLHSITEGFTDGSLDIDLGGLVTAWISSLSGILGSALDFGGEVVSAGVLLAGNLLDSLASAFDSTVSTEGVSAIGEKLGDIARKIITGITTLLPKLFEVGGKAISAGVKLATELIGSLAEGFTGTDFSGSFATMAQGLVQGIIDAVTNLPELLEGALSVGAQIVNAVMSNITTALSDLNASGVADQLGTAATNLLKTLLQNIGGLKDNAEVNTFLTNLGQSIMDGMGSLGQIVGNFCGNLLAYLFSVDGLRDIYNAGTSIVQLILEGMAAGMTGILSFIGDLIDTVLIELGIVDPETREAARAAGKELSTVIQAGMESGLMNGGGFMQELMEWSLFRGGGSLQNGKLDQNMMIFLNGIIGDAAEKAGDSAEVFRDEFISGWLNTKIFDESFWKMLFPEELGDKGEGDAFFDYLEEFMGEYDDVEAFLKDKADLTKFFPDDMDFWAGFLNAVKTGDMTELMKIMTAQATEMFGEIGQESADAAKDAGEEMAQKYHEKIVGTAEEVSEETTEIIDEMSHANKEATKGLAAAATADMGEVEKAAADVSDAAVQQYLLTMSFDNGYLIGETFVLAMGTAMSDKTADMSAIALSAGQAAYNALNGSASYANGYTIGYNFGLGFVNGIEAMIDRAASAAASLGAAGTSSLSSIIQEGSPSRITGESGDNFGLGFINHILDSADGAANAAARMGQSAGEALAYTVRGIGAEAAEIPLPQRSGYARMAEAYPGGQQNNPAIEQMTNRIIEAMSHMGVYIDGEPAGHVLTPYISEEIAHNTSVRR